tara:strand:+ start:327 stop:515 length:189 start_codon:yes stop_codon:yes gene_type:complete
MNYKFFKLPDGTQADDAILRITSEGIISTVPFSQANRDYQEYLKWLNGEDPYTEKGTPEAAD